MGSEVEVLPIREEVGQSQCRPGTVSSNFTVAHTCICDGRQTEISTSLQVEKRAVLPRSVHLYLPFTLNDLKYISNHD